MGKWQDLTAKQKAQVIKFARQNGVSDINTIRDTYNLYSNDGQEEILNKVNSSNANFIQRLKDPNRKSIPDWESPTDRISTHKLSVGTDENGNHYIFPEVQEINGELIDFTRPPYHRFAGEISAEMRGDTVRVPSIEDAIKFTETYKQYYPFSTGGPLYPFSFEKNPFLKTPIVRYDEGGKTYTVKKGDTFSQIAQNIGVSVQDLQKLNPTITNINKIREGQSINIPPYMFSEIFNTPQFTGLSIPQVYRTQPLQQQNTPIQSVVVPTQKGLKTAGPLDLQELAVRQAYTESRLRPEIVNDKGAYGLFQIMQPALDDYNRINKTNYTLEDMKNADNNIKVRNWYMDYLSNLGFINKGDIQSDSVQMYKTLAAFNAGAGPVREALTKAKADGKDIYDSWDWVSYLWDEPREYADFILRGIETKGTNKNDSIYKAVSTAKSSTAKKIKSSIKQ